MKTISSILTLLFMTMTINAQRDSVFLYPEGVPGLKDTSIKESNVVRPDGLLRLKDVTNPVIFPFIPEGADDKTPAVVICPGGGYAIVSITSEGFNIARWFQERGIAAFVLKYRLPSDKAFDDKKMAPLQDVHQSFKYLREHAADYNIDKKNIGIMGFSAGGHLAASASVLYKAPLVDEKAKNLRPAFSILVYPVISFTDELTHKGSRNNLIGPEWTAEEQDYYSCEKQVDSDTPMTFLIHAKDDGAVPYQNSVAYNDALEANGVSSKLVFMDEGGHGFGLKPNSATNVWIDELELWLEDVELIK